MRVSKTNITQLMLNEFYDLSRTDIEIQIAKNNGSLKDVEIEPKVITTDNEIENLIHKFYLSLSNYFSKNTGSDFTYDNANYSNYNSFKKNYLKFLHFSEQSLNKVSP
jgi:hypothetical protein